MVLSSEKNLYEKLEIPYTASFISIKTAYRRLARKYHPDLNAGDFECEKKFKEVTEAYEILSDSQKKKHYDLMHGFFEESSRTKYSEAKKAYKEKKEENTSKKEDNFSNIFSEILDGFKNTTSNAKKHAEFRKKPAPQKGSDVYTDISITFQEALLGCSKVINILHTQLCPNCEARPFLNGTKCPICGGLGEHSIHKKLNVKIPAGVKNGSKIRIANEGNKGYNGGRNGDLFLNIKIKTDSKFVYDGINVLYTVEIAPFEAVLGTQLEIPTPSGDKISMKINPHTRSGQKLRLNGLGMESPDKKGEKGDMIVTVNINLPKSLSKEEIELYKKLKDISNNN